ncbi:CotO family spore coat protein [Halobacillus litoralis]|uniref:CotO family spore coat protein n=1 Tax=Halobacillus litoralis TaxID=45668 RepID=UPI001CD40ECD|nr:CotO family spore coat protein [Halobacillus litoralis]MCA1022478.1 spore coat CotO family protein [Halobacillus litoralis]
MADEKRLAKQPMLYIVQPKNLKPAVVPMQTSFRTERSVRSRGSEEPASKETPRYEKEARMRRTHSTHTEDITKRLPEQTDTSEGEQEEDNGDKKVSSRERRQRFHELSLKEKVDYFFQLSPHVPKMKCEVTTKEDQLRGYITDYQDGVVHMKVFQRPFQREIDFETIIDIRLLGF